MSLFANPDGIWLFWLFPVLLAVALAGRFRRSRALLRWGGQERLRELARPPAREWDLVAAVCVWLAFALALIGFARPQWGEVAETVEKVGLDVVVCLDTSRSMDVTDTQPSRLERARLEIRSLLASDRDDRFGLVAFSGVPVILSPLTEDSGAINMLLDVADSDLIPVQGTDIGRAILKALKLLPEQGDRDQVILILSDGEDQAQDTAAAARKAAARGVKIFCVGVGTTAGGTVPGPGGKPVIDPSTGGPAHSSLHEEVLRQVAALTDGRYWSLNGSGSAVPAIMDELGHLKRKEYASQSRAMRQEQYAWFLGPALFLLLIAMLIPGRRMPRAQRRRPSGGATAAGLLMLAFLIAAAAVMTPSRACAQSAPRLAKQAYDAYHSGQLELAEGLYARAQREARTPDLRALLHYDRGSCLLALKKPQPAREEFMLALAGTDPGVKGAALYNLAEAFVQEGDREKALGALKTLLVMDPQDRQAELLYEWILRTMPPEPPPPPEKNPPRQPPPPKPPDVLEQLHMPPPKALQEQLQPHSESSPGMKPW